MKKSLIVFLLVAGFFLPGCASTMQTPSLDKLSDEEIEAYNSDPNNTDKIVCTDETPLGSRISKRVCRKESSINERSRSDQRTLETIQAGSTHITGKGE